MPIHNWSDVDANLFHHFHPVWTMQICLRLNAGLLPPGYTALIEQRSAGLVPDLLALQYKVKNEDSPHSSGNLVVLEPIQTEFIIQSKNETLTSRANRIAIRHRLGEVVCVIEIVSPGNKSSRSALRAFVEKVHELLGAGVHLLVIDLFPPSNRDPEGIHKAIWDEIDEEEPFTLPRDRSLTLAAYVAGDLVVGRSTTAYVQPVGLGESLPNMPAYLDSKFFVPVPLEDTYQATWESCPKEMRHLVEHGQLPSEA